MIKLRFKTADPSRRVPVYLQKGTKENLVWQLKLAGVFVAGMYIKDAIETRLERKRLNEKY